MNIQFVRWEEIQQIIRQDPSFQLFDITHFFLCIYLCFNFSFLMFCHFLYHIITYSSHENIETFLKRFWLIFYLRFYLGIEGFFGGAMCFNMGLFSYLADTTTEHDRTFRMSLLTGLYHFPFSHICSENFTLKEN